MARKKTTSVGCILLPAFVLLFSIPAPAQLLKKIKDASKNIQEAATNITTATVAVNNTVKIVKYTWKKDTSANIRYQQIPDYRTREEVDISKKQKLSVENGQFVNLSWEPVTKFDNQLFPSFIIGWANYKGIKDEDMGSSLGFTINTNLPGVVLKWEIESADKNYFNIDSGFIRYDDIRALKFFCQRSPGIIKL
jgi:hypothetical protein